MLGNQDPCGCLLWPFAAGETMPGSEQLLHKSVLCLCPPTAKNEGQTSCTCVFLPLLNTSSHPCSSWKCTEPTSDMWGVGAVVSWPEQCWEHEPCKKKLNFFCSSTDCHCVTEIENSCLTWAWACYFVLFSPPLLTAFALFRASSYVNRCVIALEGTSRWHRAARHLLISKCHLLTHFQCFLFVLVEAAPDREMDIGVSSSCCRAEPVQLLGWMNSLIPASLVRATEGHHRVLPHLLS